RAGLRKRDRPSASRDRPVPEEDLAVGERTRLRERDPEGLLEALENRPPLPERDRVDEDLKLVDEAFLRERDDDPTTPEDDHVGARLALRAAHLCRRVAAEQRRVLPLDTAQGAREDDLRQGIHLAGDDGVRLRGRGRRPPAGHQLVCDAAEDEHAAAAGIRRNELSVLEIVAVLVRPPEVAARTREEAVERDVVEDTQMPHREPTGASSGPTNRVSDRARRGASRRAAARAAPGAGGPPRPARCLWPSRSPTAPSHAGGSAAPRGRTRNGAPPRRRRPASGRRRRATECRS